MNLKSASLNILLYVAPGAANGGANANPAEAARPDLSAALNAWLESSITLRTALNKL